MQERANQKEHSGLKLLKESYFSKKEWKAENQNTDPKEQNDILESCMGIVMI